MGKEKANVLELSFDEEYEIYQSGGCAPNISKINILLKLDKDIENVYIVSEGKYLDRFSGGSVLIGEKVGYLNSKMEVIENRIRVRKYVR